MNQRGFVLVEFVIALPVLIFLLYALGTLTLTTAKIAREQVADYTLETEAQEIIDRITADARAAYSVKINTRNTFDEIIFICHTNAQGKNFSTLIDELDQRIYMVASASGKPFHVYFKNQDTDAHNNPLTGENSFGNTFVTKLEFSKEFLPQKILHITFEMQSLRRNQKVKFSTAVYMPACKEIIYHGEKIL